MSDGKMEEEMNRLFGAASVPNCCGEELNRMAKLSIYCSVYGYELWVVTRVWVSPWRQGEELGVELLLLDVERS